MTAAETPADISVIVVTRNRAALLRGCLESLASQTRRVREIIVVDNASSDGTPGVVREYTGRLPLVYVTEDTVDVAAARNSGVAKAGGSVIAFTDDDCRVDPDWAETIERLHSVSAEPVIGGVTRNGYPRNMLCFLWEKLYILWFNCVNVCGKRKGWYSLPLVPCRVKTLFTNNISYRKEVFGERPWFRHGVSMNEDAEFHYRLRERGHAILYSPEMGASHYYRTTLRAMTGALFRSGRGVSLISDGGKVRNSFLEIPLKEKVRFAVLLLAYPALLFSRGELLAALLILPFAIYEKCVKLAGFCSARQHAQR